MNAKHPQILFKFCELLSGFVPRSSPQSSTATGGAEDIDLEVEEGNEEVASCAGGVEWVKNRQVLVGCSWF